MIGEVPAQPRVWLLLGDKGGDNAQLRVLAQALGWPSEEKPLVFNRRYQVPNLLLGATLSTLDPACPPPAPPWPDLILSSGRRAVPVARWIRRQSGGRTRLVHVGRTWAPLHWFDLVIAMPQYRVARAANVMRAHLPLNRLAPQRLAGEADDWRTRVAHLPRPYTTVLLGEVVVLGQVEQITGNRILAIGGYVGDLRAARVLIHARDGRGLELINLGTGNAAGDFHARIHARLLSRRRRLHQQRAQHQQTAQPLAFHGTSRHVGGISSRAPGPKFTRARAPCSTV